MHQKKLLSLLTAGLLFFTACPQMPAAAAETGDFLIERGWLVEYTGNDSVVHIPEGVIGIGFHAFVRQKTVTNVSNPALTLNIPYNGFLEEVYLPESLQLIEDHAFYGCVSLKKVHFQEGLTEIEDYAFADYRELDYSAYGLTDAEMEMHLESVELPDSLQTIGAYAFRGSGLDSVSFGSGLEELGREAFAYTDLTSVTLPESLHSFGQYAFAYSAVETVQLPEQLEEIPEGAFMESRLKSVVIPEPVHTIGENAFRGTVLNRIQFPPAVSTIGSYAFADTPLTDVIYRGTVGNFGKNVYANTPYAGRGTEFEGDFEILDGKLIQYQGNDVTVTIPDSVEVITEAAFQGAPRMMYLVLPDSVRLINDRAFANCSQLRAVQFGSGLETIGSEVFMNCKKLRRIKLPDSVKSIGWSVFENCTSLTDVRLNDGLETAEKSCFNGCSALKTLRIPSSLKQYDTTYYMHDKANRKWTEMSGAALTFYLNNPDFLDVTKQEVVKCCLLSPDLNDVVLYGDSDSAAPEIAEELQLVWKPLSDLPAFDPVPDGPDMTLNLSTDTWKFVNAGSVFGSERYMTDAARTLAKQTVNGELADFDQAFDGSCYGMSLTVIIAKAGKLRASDMLAGAENLRQLDPEPDVQSVINFYHYMQYAQKLTVSSGSTADDQIADMLETAVLIPHGELPFLLSFSTQSGNHAVVGYGAESGAWTQDGRQYDRRILIWDPNNPAELNDSACLYINMQTLDYCIPLYEVLYENEENGVKHGELISWSNDLERLLPVEYPFSAQTAFKRGDMNCDGHTDVSDAVLLARFLAEDRDAIVSDQGIQNAETDGEAGLTMSDLTVLLKIIAKIIR